MTPERLAEIEARAEAATPGEWHVCTCSLKGACPHDKGVRMSFCTEGLPDKAPYPNDADFIAHARQDIPDLIAEVRRLREEKEKLRRIADRYYGLCEEMGLEN